MHIHRFLGIDSLMDAYVGAAVVYLTLLQLGEIASSDAIIRYPTHSALHASPNRITLNCPLPTRRLATQHVRRMAHHFVSHGLPLLQRSLAYDRDLLPVLTRRKWRPSLRPRRDLHMLCRAALKMRMLDAVLRGMDMWVLPRTLVVHGDGTRHICQAKTDFAVVLTAGYWRRCF